MESMAWAALPPRRTVEPFWTGSLLAGLLFIPGAVSFFIDGASFVVGTTLMCLAALALAGTGRFPLGVRDVQGALAATLLVGLLVGSHLLVAYIINRDDAFNAGRALLSFLVLGLAILSVPVVCGAMAAAGDRMGLVVKTLCGAFAIIAILSLLKIQPPTPSLGEKPTFPYTEPSFLGFSMPAVLIFTLVRLPLPARVAVIGAFLGLGYALSNLTIIAACSLAALVTLPASWLAVGGTLAVLSEVSLDLSYYTDRLDLDWANSTNLSSLVYIQGWQMIQESLDRTAGWGVGFQQLGVVYTNVPASFRINALLGRDANLQDGGFVLSKLGGEFGVLGLALAAAYLWIAARSFLRLRRAAGGATSMQDAELLARACVIGYVIELLVRGTNYFTGTFVLLLAGLLYLHRARRTEAAAA